MSAKYPEVEHIRRWEVVGRAYGLFDAADYYRQWADALEAGRSPVHDDSWNCAFPQWVEPPPELFKPFLEAIATVS